MKAAAGLFAALSVLSSGCGRSGETDSILLVGSTAMETFVSALAEDYMDKRENVTVTAQFPGSEAGILAVLEHKASVGCVSRFLSEDEKAHGAVENIVAYDPVAVCVDADNDITTITAEELSQIYAGTVTNWAQLGGRDVPVVVIGREAGSGTRQAFEKWLGMEGECVYTNEYSSDGAVMAKVSSIHGAVGYISASLADDSVNVLALDGIKPVEENVINGLYTLNRPFVMVTAGEIDGQPEPVREWFDYVLGRQGQKLAHSIGLVPVK